MSIWADCDICKRTAPCDLIDGMCLCDDCYDDYERTLEESDPDYNCDGDCDVCGDYENCQGGWRI